VPSLAALRHSEAGTVSKKASLRAGVEAPHGFAGLEPEHRDNTAFKAGGWAYKLRRRPPPQGVEDRRVFGGLEPEEADATFLCFPMGDTWRGSFSDR